MAFLVSIAELFNKPSGLWEILILNVFEFISNYGWRILFFTICLKLLLFPLDLYQRLKMHKNQLITERMKPQLEKLQQQYGSNKQVFAQKQMELNKKEGFSYFSSCLPMIVTMVIFFYLFSGLQNISYYMNLKQYAGLYDTYVATEQLYQSGTEDVTITIGDKTEKINYVTHLQAKPAENTEEYKGWLIRKEKLDSTIAGLSKSSVVTFYEETSKESFLWIKNIWSPDVPWTKPIPDASAFSRNIGGYNSIGDVRKKLDVTEEQLSDAAFQKMLGDYDMVTDYLQKSDNNRVNGYLILPILSIGLSFLSQFITSRLQKKSGQASPAGGMGNSMKIMMFIMPLMMGFFALQYTSAFTLYIVINSSMSILVNVLSTFFIKLKSRPKSTVSGDVIISYGRPDPSKLNSFTDSKADKKADKKTEEKVEQKPKKLKKFR